MRGMAVGMGQEPGLKDGPEAPSAPPKPRHRRRWWHRGPFVRREVRISVGVVIVFLFAFYIALPLLASHRSEVESLGHIRFQYVALGLLLQIGALAAYTELTRTVLPSGQLSRFRVFRINLSTLALNHVSPGGGAPGAALWYRLATQSGVSSGDSGFALATQGIGSAVVLNALFWLSLVVFLIIHGFHPPTGHTGGASVSVSILVTVAAALGVVVMTAFGGIFYLLTRGQDRAKDLVKRIALRLHFRHPDRIAESVEGVANRFALLLENKPLLYRALIWATANWLLDAASLWVFVGAFSHFISPVDLMVAYGLANVLAAIPITPGGLGIVEFVLVSMITSFGPTADQALSAVLAYRAVNFWLPIPFGGLAYASLEFERGTLYRRLHLFFLHRYQVRRGSDPADPVGLSASNGRAAPPSSNGSSGRGGEGQAPDPAGAAGAAGAPGTIVSPPGQVPGRRGVAEPLARRCPRPGRAPR